MDVAHTYKLKSEDDLKTFLTSQKEEGVSYIMEEFVKATVNSYDAIIDSKGEPIFEIETDKVVNQITASEDGVLLRKLVEEGDEVTVNAPVADVEAQ